MKVGTILTIPIRLEYLNGDFDKAQEILLQNGIKIVYRTVASVEPYHGTIHVEPEEGDRVKDMFNQAGIRWYPPCPFY